MIQVQPSQSPRSCSCCLSLSMAEPTRGWMLREVRQGGLCRGSSLRHATGVATRGRHGGMAHGEIGSLGPRREMGSEDWGRAVGEGKGRPGRWGQKRGRAAALDGEEDPHTVTASIAKPIHVRWLRRVCCCVLVPVAANAANLLCPWSVSLSGCGARGTPCRRARRVLHPASLQARKPARRYLGTEVRAEGLTYHMHRTGPRSRPDSQPVDSSPAASGGSVAAFCLPRAAATVLVCSLAWPLLVLSLISAGLGPSRAHSFLSAHAILLRRRCDSGVGKKLDTKKGLMGPATLGFFFFFALLAQPAGSGMILPSAAAPELACWGLQPVSSQSKQSGPVGVPETHFRSFVVSIGTLLPAQTPPPDKQAQR